MKFWAESMKMATMIATDEYKVDADDSDSDEDDEIDDCDAGDDDDVLHQHAPLYTNICDRLIGDVAVTSPFYVWAKICLVSISITPLDDGTATKTTSSRYSL